MSGRGGVVSDAEHDGAAASAAFAGLLRCADHAVMQVMELGCCCVPDVVALGWMPGPDGAPAPLMTLMHKEWCSYLRARDRGQALPEVRCVEIKRDEGAS